MPIYFGLEFEMLAPTPGIRRNLLRIQEDLRKEVPSIGAWCAHNDISIGSYGDYTAQAIWALELVTPPGGLLYCPPNLKDVHTVVKYLKRKGYKTNESCGLHIHLSLGHRKNLMPLQALCLWQNVYNNEHRFYRLYPSRRHNGSADTLRHQTGSFHREVYRVFKKAIREQDAKLLALYLSQYNRPNLWHEHNFWRNYERYMGLNLSELASSGKHEGRLRTVEFRYGAGDLKVGLVDKYIKLCVSFYKEALHSTLFCYKDLVIMQNGEGRYYLSCGKHSLAFSCNI